MAWRTESGLRYVDVWQSKDDHEAFTEGRLHPVVHPILQDMLGFVPPEPPQTVLDVIDAWTDGIRPDRHRRKAPGTNTMTNDVVVVGGRCAGAPTAMLLTRAGLSVRLLERSAASPT